MSAIYQVRPLTDYTIFTTPSDQRKGVRFTAELSTTLAELKTELGYLDAHDVVLELAVQPRHIRKDGELRSDAPANLPHPGVRLSFRSRHGDLSFTCDTYEARWMGQMPDWQANLRAIVLSLESLRAVERHGVLKGEQYVGMKAIGAGSGATPLGGMTKDQALDVLYKASGVTPAETADLPRVHRMARAEAHPDRNGGDRIAWDQVEQAAVVLGIPR